MDGGIADVSPNLSVDELAAQITELAGHLNAANYRWLRLIAEFDRRNGWSDGTLKSCAHWPQPDGTWRFLEEDGSVFHDVGSTQAPDYALTDLLETHQEQG